MSVQFGFASHDDGNWIHLGNISGRETRDAVAHVPTILSSLLRALVAILYLPL